MKKSSFILPLILTIAAVEYLRWASDFPGSVGSVLITSIPGISAALSSVIAIIMIGKYKLDINRHLLMYIVTSLFSAAAGIAMMYAVSKLLDMMLYIDIYKIQVYVPANVWNAITSILTVIVLIVTVKAQFFLLNKKIKSFSEKFVLIILNPVLYVLIWDMAWGIEVSIYGWK